MHPKTDCHLTQLALGEKHVQPFLASCQRAAGNKLREKMRGGKRIQINGLEKNHVDAYYSLIKCRRKSYYFAYVWDSSADFSSDWSAYENDWDSRLNHLNVNHYLFMIVRMMRLISRIGFRLLSFFQYLYPVVVRSFRISRVRVFSMFIHHLF